MEVTPSTLKPPRDRDRDRDGLIGRPSLVGATTTTNGPPGSLVFEGIQQRTVKRPRPVKSCLACRSKKLKCDRLAPCSQCEKGRRVCRYADQGPAASESSDEGEPTSACERPPQKRMAVAPGPPGASPVMPAGTRPSFSADASSLNGTAASDASLNDPMRAGFEEMATRLERLEQLLLAKNAGESLASTPAQPSVYCAAAPGMMQASAASNIPAVKHELNNSNPIHHIDTSVGSNAAARSANANPVATLPVTIRSLTIKGNRSMRTRFFGQNSTRVLLNLFDEAQDFMYNKANKRESARELFQQLQKIYAALQEQQRRALAPITVFVDSVLPVSKRMADILPSSKAVCDRLLDAYESTSEGLYRVVHVPTFRAEYQAYWDGQRCSDGFLPQLLCMLSIGSRFETESRGLGHDRSEGVHIPTACALVRAWLDGLRGKQLVDVGTLLAEVLLLHAQRMIVPRYQDSWTQLGAIIRMAMTMGLHRDPSEFPQIRPFAAECRRKLWYTLLDMDLHLSLGCNLPCSVRDGEYTCQPPLNLDDEDLRPDMATLPPAKPMDVRTDGQLQAYAASTLPIRMQATALVSRLDTIRDYDEVLDVGSRLERLLDDINCLFPRNHQHEGLNPSGKYKEWRERALLDMHIRRPLLALYRPFALSSDGCPPQISSTYLKSSMVLLTYLDELDPRTPGFADVNHMYYVILKHDIIQAAFSVCYYIGGTHESRSAGSDTATSTPTSHATGQFNGGYSMGTTSNSVPWNAMAAGSPSSNDGEYVNHRVGRPIWSSPRMLTVVEKTLNDLIMLIRDSTWDLKDIVALSTVIKSVQPDGNPEQRLERMTDGIRRIMEACLSTVKMGAGNGLNHHGDGLVGGPAAALSLFSPAAAVDGRPGMFDQTTYSSYPGAKSMPVHSFAGMGQLTSAGFLDEFPLWDADY